MSEFRLKVPTKRERIRALLEDIPDDVGKLPEGEIDAEETADRMQSGSRLSTCPAAVRDPLFFATVPPRPPQQLTTGHEKIARALAVG